MKSHLLLISTMLATTAGLGISTAYSTQPDAQAQAAALLGSRYEAASASARGDANPSLQSGGGDAHAHASALLSGARAGRDANTSVQITPSRAARSLDAQAHAATLLSSGSRTTAGENPRTTATAEKLGEHPALAAARIWATRGIDPNTFIVAHPAGVQLITASPSEKEDAQRTDIQATASTKVSGRVEDRAGK